MNHGKHGPEPTPAGGATVALVGVTKTYRGGSGEPVVAVDNVTLDMAAGECVALMGRSGSGKSTLLHLVGGMDTADGGGVTVGGNDLAALRDSQRAAFRRSLGFVFQRFHLLPALTAIDNVLAPVLPYRTAFDKTARAHQLLEAVGLTDRATHLPAKLSGGEQQRVAIARALINQPSLLLADEPTGNLDSQTGADVIGLLLRLRDDTGFTLLIATHDAAIATRCDRVVELADGRVASDQRHEGR